jgi:hypothetical protein
MKPFFIRLLLTTALTFLACTTQAVQPQTVQHQENQPIEDHPREDQSLVEHELSVRLNPQQQQLYVEDKITLPANAAREIIFSLHKGLQPKTNTDEVKISPLKSTTKTLYRLYKLQLPIQLNSFTLLYEGRIDHPLETRGKEQAGGIRNTPGLISTEGVFLAASSHWFAQFEKHPYIRFTMRVELPSGWKSVSQGTREQHKNVNGIAIDHWHSPTPQEEIYLIAAQFTEYSRKMDNIISQVFLRQPDEELAKSYLDATARFIPVYEKLLGSYPYSKFATVENFWETGYGMPSFTLLGSRVIRFPFILYTSFPHEILHNWWGNGVFVDFSSGNWSEGLTTYLADHLIQQQRSKGADYRLQSLQKYRDYAAKGRDFPLNQFRARHSSATAAVGYGKSMMLFHMLRQKLGDELFIQSLQLFYHDYQFQKASFDDLRKSFEKTSGLKLDHFFQQWFERTGAPKLKLEQANVIKRSENYQLSFTLKQVQANAVYNLKIPVAITLQGKKKAEQRFVNMSQKNQRFEMHFNSNPLRIDIDPEYDLFRQLALEETPPAFTQLFGARRLLIVLPYSSPSTLKAGWKSFAQDLTKMGPEKVTVKWDSELDFLPDNQAVIILGWKNRFATEINPALSDYKAMIKQERFSIEHAHTTLNRHSIALTTRNQSKNLLPRAFIATDLEKALPGLARKLPHYHKYSYLVFSGDEPQIEQKGRWTVTQSPMSVLFNKETERGLLAKRPALIEAKPPF